MANRLSQLEVIDIKKFRKLNYSWRKIADILNKNRKREYTDNWYRLRYMETLEKHDNAKIKLGQKYMATKEIKNHYLPGVEYRKDIMTCIGKYNSFYLFETSKGIRICINRNDDYELREVAR